MSDDHLRELERMFRQNRSEEDLVSLVQERLRLGIPIDEKVYIAAYCGHPAFARLLNMDSPSEDLGQWTERIPFISQLPLLAVRVAVTASSFVLPRFEVLRPYDHRLRQANLAVLRYLFSPHTIKGGHEAIDTKQVAAEVIADAGSLAIQFANEGRGGTGDEFRDGLIAIKKAFSCASIAFAAIGAATTCGLNPVEAAPHTILAVCSAAEALENRGELKQAICDSLIPWALGYKDPLQDLVTQLEATPTQD